MLILKCFMFCVNGCETPPVVWTKVVIRGYCELCKEWLKPQLVTCYFRNGRFDSRPEPQPS